MIFIMKIHLNILITYGIASNNIIRILTRFQINIWNYNK